jgi:catechol 2,3-dioxygenase-like lactoylglutathione lyase family enzyme
MGMAETATGTRITQVGPVFVPVGDQDRAIEFYVEELGFEKLADFRYGDGERWVEVAPPGAATNVALVTPPEGHSAGVETGVVFASEDVDADHAALRTRGVDVDDAILRPGDPVVHWAGAGLAGVPPMFLLRDPDGNSFLIVQGT